MKYSLDSSNFLKEISSLSHSIVFLYFFAMTAAAAAKSLQSCPTLCNPIDRSPPGSSVPGILQARTLEWVAISFSNAWEWKLKVKSLSPVQLFVTPWTVTHQAPPSTGFSRQEYWGRLYYFSLIFFGTLHSNTYIFHFLLCFSLLLFSQLFIRPPQAVILLFLFLFLGDGLDPCLLYNVTNFHP